MLSRVMRVLIFAFLTLALLLGAGLLAGDARASKQAEASSLNDTKGRAANVTQPIANNPIGPQETCPPGTPTRVPMPLFTPAPNCSDVPPTGVLTATITDHFNTTEAAFTNTSATCSYRIGLATYRKFDENIENQELFDYRLAVIPPNSTLVLTVNNPTCAYQGDAFYGDILYSFAGGARYEERRLDDTDGVHTNYCTVSCSGTPIATNTPESTGTPTNTGTPAITNTPANTNIRTATRTSTIIPTATRTLLGDGFLAFEPEGPAPPNGGTVNVGDRFVLGLWLNTGSYPDVTAQQSYLTYTYDLIKNARVDQIATSCVLTNTVTADHTIFDAPLVNEICNGPTNCNFRFVVDPGSFAYVSGALINCPDGCGGFFRVAQVGLCAVAPGRALLHWQFSPPAPRQRDTEIVVVNGDLIQNPALFTDYVINIAGSTYTPTSTPTQGSPTATPTTMHTNTPTPAPVRDAFMALVPEGSAPPNGGTVTVGDRFVLDLWLNAGSNNVAAQQSYLTYTYNLIQNARVDQITTTCVLTNTVTPDYTVFDISTQNEVCNGPGQCNFRGVVIGPGSFAYAASVGNCQLGCGGYFRVAQVGLCAVAPGRALLHWQFSPPAPRLRDSEIITRDTTQVQNPDLYADYVINIVNPTSTPTSTPVRVMVGHVTWQGRPAQPSARQQVPISVSLSLGTTQVNYTGLNTDPNGFFTVTLGSLTNGNYTWRVKGYDPQWGGPAFLANSGTVALMGAPTAQVEMKLMRAGDANNDNLVNVRDFNILKNTFGRPCNPCQNPRSDFNGDSLINLPDFNLLKANFSASGAP